MGQQWLYDEYVVVWGPETVPRLRLLRLCCKKLESGGGLRHATVFLERAQSSSGCERTRARKFALSCVHPDLASWAFTESPDVLKVSWVLPCGHTVRPG